MENIRYLELKYVPETAVDYTKYSDKQLMFLCQKYGTQTILWRQRFIGLLPEVNRRKLYEKKGYSSIIEFGKRMAGLSEAQIRLAINLEKKFEDKPELHEALVKGEISMNKLVRVASIATAENEEELAKYAKVLSKTSLDVLVRDVKQSGTNEIRIGNGLFEPQIDVESLPGQSELNFQLNPEVVQKLNTLHEKGIDVNEVLKEILEKRESEIAERRDEIASEIVEREEKRCIDGKAPSRYVSVKTKRILSEEYGTKCGVVSCKRVAMQLHHAVPFSMGGSNSPDSLKPLCREHHDILHSINSNYVRKKCEV